MAKKHGASFNNGQQKKGIKEEVKALYEEVKKETGKGPKNQFSSDHQPETRGRKHDAAIDLRNYYSRGQTKQWILDVWHSLESDLFDIMNRSDIPAGKKLLASVLVNAIQCSDYKALETFLNRIIGKIPEAKPDEESVDDKMPDQARQALLESLIGVQLQRPN